jgi:hypothetical protein
LLRDVADVQAVTADELRGEVAVEGDAVSAWTAMACAGEVAAAMS